MAHLKLSSGSGMNMKIIRISIETKGEPYEKLQQMKNGRFGTFHDLAVAVKEGATKELQIEAVMMHKFCFNYIDDPYPEVIELNKFLWEL